MIALGITPDEILKDFPALEPDDLVAAQAYATTQVSATKRPESPF